MRVKRFPNGTLVVDVRNYYQAAGGKWAPTPKGVALGVGKWMALVKAAAAVTKALGR